MSEYEDFLELLKYKAQEKSKPLKLATGEVGLKLFNEALEPDAKSQTFLNTKPMEESKVFVKGILKAPSKLREFIKGGHNFVVNGIDCYTAPPIILASDPRGMAVLSVPFMVEVRKESGSTSISIANDTMFHSFILNDEQLAVLIEKLVHGA